MEDADEEGMPMSDFFQDGPVLTNQYDDDRTLRAYLRRKLPATMLAEIEPGLRRLGERAITDILTLGNAAEASPPRHVPYDPWGRRVDRIEVCPAWKQLEGIAAEEGIVATAYERRHGPLSRIHQFARLYLYGPSSAIATCPLAMTDGAARVIELYGDDWLRTQPLPRLLSRDPAEFWTSGQWMTERTGGSDISGTSTVARWEDGQFRLYGTKWFTSATTSPMAMTLARVAASGPLATSSAPTRSVSEERITNPSYSVSEERRTGSTSLSLFYLELRDEAGTLQNIRVHRLKDKLGTRALPTAELTLEGTPARLVGGEGQGVRKIAALLNITRAYNACCAVGFMRRGLALARDYARKRRVFGKLLADQPLHQETLATLQVEFEAAFHLTFHLAELMGKEETGEARPEEKAVLRLLTPVVKLYTARQGIASASEVLEAFGGAGYVEDTGLPRLLRDAQVLSIWEGTTNVLSLDTLRAIEKDAAWEPFLADVRTRLAMIQSPALQTWGLRVREATGRIDAYLRRTSPATALAGEGSLQAGARGFAFSLARTYAASLLLEHADWLLSKEGDQRGMAVAARWCAQELAPLRSDADNPAVSRALAMDETLV
jgi:alkylation response protein AidB-like acyl-CoA dehydrogenase